MKNICITTLMLFTALTFSQVSFKVNPSKVKEVKNTSYDRFNYIEVHPKEFCGNYYKHSDYNKFGMQWSVETEITLNPDGTCKTRWYNSGYSGRKPKTTLVSGTWAMAVKDNKPITKLKDGNTWYQIILMSGSDKKLAYYDHSAYYDWVTADKTTSYLQLVFSSDAPVQKQKK
ncbi:hypothetical protein [Wenyingzhuangia marina]|uniref:Uncharacterized protein n=1 Tax=Wenyingzhuangia marina TaxID=1195760 RepID=A0A1M5TW85_9FLAO|nr:hypothetical protein [Wenyingzhuangia marina]GGF70705.1 hypothetical protein GCM10011397_12090 [Wenyingzhuangia marina]SHH55052.1 hypothetical protein SAMN05444281_0886 [Wenyingzhuangia marina]